MYSLETLFVAFEQTDIYQPACPSNSTLFVIASPRLFAHSVMPQTPLSLKKINIQIARLPRPLRSEPSLLVKQQQRECCLRDWQVDKWVCIFK